MGWVTAFGLPPRPTQPGHPSVGRRNDYWRWLQPPLGKKTASSAYTSTPATRTSGPNWLKAPAVKLSRSSGRSGSYTGLIGLPAQRAKRGYELPRNDLSVYAKYSSVLFFFKVIGTNTDRPVFLLTFHSNHGLMSYRFREKRRLQFFFNPRVFNAPAEGVLWN